MNPWNKSIATERSMTSLKPPDDEPEHKEKREKYEKSLTENNLWGYSRKGIEARKAVMTMLSTKTGMYAKIPLICKGDGCPYADTCPLLPYDLAPAGEYCPHETAQIELRAGAYANEVGLDPESFTDRQLLNEIVGYDIMLERCRALMAKEGTPVIDITIGVTEEGDEIRQPAVSKAWEAYEKIVKKRNEAYQLMLMTRRDKNKNGETNQDSISELLKNVIDSRDFEVHEEE